MPVIFHYLSGSPFAWKVWLALEHKGIAYELRVLSRDEGDLATKAFLAMNPHGKAPVIAHDGFVLFESAAIVEYLEEAFPGPSLWPEGAKARAIARRQMAECQSYVYPAVRRLVDELLMKGPVPADYAAVEKARTDATSSIAILTASVKELFLGGAAPCAADYSLYPLSAILARLAARFPQHGLAEPLPQSFIDWRARMQALPIVHATHPPHWSQQQ